MMTHSIIVDTIHYYKNITLRRLTCVRKFNSQSRVYHLISDFLHQRIQNGNDINGMKKLFELCFGYFVVITKAFILLKEFTLVKKMVIVDFDSKHGTLSR